MPSPSFTAMVFPRPGAVFLIAFVCGGNHHFLWVSEVTLGSFWLLFSAFSVLHCHGVSPSRNCFFECFLVRRKSPFVSVLEVTLGSFWLLFGAFSVLQCHGVSPSRSCFFECLRVRRKSSFSVGFRSDVREFLAAFWCLLRPSLPWCFPVLELLF